MGVVLVAQVAMVFRVLLAALRVQPSATNRLDLAAVGLAISAAALGFLPYTPPDPAPDVSGGHMHFSLLAAARWTGETAGGLALLIAVMSVVRRIRLRRTVTRFASQLTPVLMDIGDHITHRYPSQPTAPSFAVTRHLQTSAHIPWWRSHKAVAALMDLRHGAVTATEAVRAILCGAPQDEELRAKLCALLAVRNDILDAVHRHVTPAWPARQRA